MDYFGQEHHAQHNDVFTWQEQMAWRGWRLAVDGIFGPQSDLVCRDFQEAKDLDVDGLVGPNTWEVSWNTPVDVAEINQMHGGAEQGELHLRG